MAEDLRTNILSAVLALVAGQSVAFAQSAADAFVAKIPGANIASSVTLSTAGGAGAPGKTVEIPFYLSSAATGPASFQFDVSFNPQILTFVSARVGAQLTAVGKGLSSSLLSGGDVRLSIPNPNQNTIASGPVAYASFTVSPLFAGSTPLTLVNCMSATGLGSALSTSCTPGNIVPFTCDLIGTGTVSVADVQLLVNQALGVTPPVNDMNHDGVVNVADVQKVINAALGLGCPY